MATTYTVDANPANGDFTTIADAIAAASDGDTIQINAGIYAETLTVDKALSFVGVGDVTIAPASGTAVDIQAGVDGDVSFDNIVLDGSGAASFGITVDAGANVGTLGFANGEITGFVNRGIYASDDGDPVSTPTMGDIEVTDSSFSNNGTGSGNTAHVKLFGYSGDALFQNVTFAGTTGVSGSAGRPDNAIEITGGLASPGNAHPTPADSPDIASIVFDGVTVTGEYHKNPIAIFHFSEIDGLSITGLDLSGAESSWGPLFNIDGIEDASIDASGYDITFPATDAIHTELQGEEDGQGSVDTTITGTDANDSLHGKTGNDTLLGGDGDDVLYGGNKPGQDFDDGPGNDTLDGGAGDDQMFGGIGNDRLIGTDGDDTLDGGDGTDVGVIADNGGSPLADLSAFDFSGATVTGGTVSGTIGVDARTLTVDGLEVLEVANTGSSTFVVLDGMSIQEAIDAASDGDTIIVNAGTYTENLIVDKEVTLQANGEVILEGTIDDQLSIPDGTALNDYFEANHPAYSATTGIEVQADNVTIDGFTISHFSVGVHLNANNDGVSITNNTFTDNVTGLRKSTATEATNLDVSDNTFTQGIHGMTIYAADGGGSFDTVTLNDNVFSALSEKGMYFEQLSNATLEGNSFDDVGNYGRISPPFGGTDGEFGQAIDINLKFGTYSNVTFTDTVITNSGNSDQDGAGSPGAFGAAIGVKTRDDGGTYGSNPASFTGQIVFEGGSIDGTSTGFRIGEPGKDNLGPDVLIDGVLIANATVTDVDNATHATTGGTVTVNLAETQADLDASVSQAPVNITGNDLGNTILGGSGDDDIDGGLGDDTITAGAGDDTVDGGEGDNDIAKFDGNQADYTVDVGAGTVTHNGTGDVTTLTNVEVLDFLDGTVSLAGEPSSGYDFAGDGSADILFQADSGYTQILNDGDTAQATSLGTRAETIAIADFNGDGEDDILFQSDSGFTQILLSGDTAETQSLGTRASLAGVGDFNGDGEDDVVFQSDSGYVSMLLSGDTTQSEVIGTRGTLVGIADFNGDGEDDALYQSDSGWTQLLLSNDPGEAQTLGSRPDFAGAGDFNGDGEMDAVFQSETGFTQVLLSGDTASAVNLGTRSDVAGIGDFDGDGEDDIVFQSDSGYTQILLSADTTQARNLGSRGDLAGIGDFDNDGEADIVFQATSGYTQILFSGETSQTQNIGTRPDLVGIGDFNGDQEDDLLFQSDSGFTQILESGDPAETVNLGTRGDAEGFGTVAGLGTDDDLFIA